MVRSKHFKPVGDGDGKSSIVIATLTTLPSPAECATSGVTVSSVLKALAYFICKITEVHEKLE